MKSKVLIFLAVLFLKSAFSQTTITFENGNKTIEYGKYTEFSFFEKENTSNGDSIIIKYRGQFNRFNLDSIELTPLDITKYIYHPDKRVLENNLGYFNDTISKVSLSLNNVYKINYSRDGLNSTTTVISILSAISALFVSPLISINFKNKTFNTQKYARITGISLATFAISMTLNISLSERTFNLKGNKKVWAIKK